MRLQPGSVFAGYTIERPLGAGGMGVVYLARHPRLRRMVALKVLNDALAAEPGVRARFDREAELASRLDHPNVVPVYDRSDPGDDALWLSMKFVDGGDATALLARAGGRLPAAQAVRLITDAARALDYAHRNDVLHRDIKPANLLIEHGGQDIERALLTDFGIARTLDDTVTLSGITATLAYTAPERFRGEPADHRADIYSLGCTLYQLLTGRTPFPRADQAAVVGAHLTAPPPRPSDTEPGLPTRLDDVIAAAMAKSPEQRPQTCAALAAAAAGVLADAARETFVHHPVPPMPSPSRTPPPTSDPSLRIPRHRASWVRRSTIPVTTLTEQGSGWALEFSPDGQLLAAVGPDNTVELWHVPGRRQVMTLRGHQDPVAALAFSPDGAQLATGSWDHTAQLWDLRSGRSLKTFTGHTDWVQAVAFSPDGTLLATGSSDRTTRLWNVRTGTQVARPRWAARIRCTPSRSAGTTRYSPAAVSVSASDSGTSPRGDRRASSPGCTAT
ncbi:WD40 repeat domain-containing serine/threonine protein kinase [Nocardia sp. NPDC052566]|uniref:WD40 repeat domain-containing serine/threonine protein kinase n=1 Tax=Nocardia sp. NPDC052566 TaxID=3364330 RepID=UPI0037CC8574